MRLLSSFLFLALNVWKSSAFDYGLVEEPEDPGILLSDVETGITDIKTIFINSLISVEATGIQWEELPEGEATPDVLEWKTTVDGQVQASGVFNLTDIGRELPSEMMVGEITVGSNGRHQIVVTLTLGDTFFETSGEYESYAAGVSIIPLLLILVLAATTHMVRSTTMKSRSLSNPRQIRHEFLCLWIDNLCCIISLILIIICNASLFTRSNCRCLRGYLLALAWCRVT